MPSQQLQIDGEGVPPLPGCPALQLMPLASLMAT
jgi:hypothetical protein